MKSNNKTIFVRTSSGEAEISRRTNHLSGDIKRTLLLVDGKSTVDELTKHAAPSLRTSMGAMLKQLLDGGFIEDKAAPQSPPKATPKSSSMPKMAVPKMAKPGKMVEEDEMEELDFTTIMRAPSPEVLAAEAEKARARELAEAQARKEAEAKQHAAAEAERRKAEQEAERARAEMAKAKAEIEAAKAKAEAEAKAVAEARAKAKAEIEAARAKAEAEAKAIAEAQAKAKAEIEAARHKAEQEAAKARAEAEAIRKQAEQEAERARAEAEAAAARAKAEAERKAKEEAERKAKAEAERKAKEEAERKAKAEAERKAKEEAERKAKEEAERKAREEQASAHAEFDITKLKTGQGAARSTIATVLFFDVVGYTKLSVSRQSEIKEQFNLLVSEFIKEFDDSQRIVLDTGDGAAIGFLQHPEDALDVAMKFRERVTANRHHDYPELKVRAGIHLGAINVVKDMNGQFNMVGDGINDAQRIMSFADADQIFVSRGYFDVVSRLTEEYASLFKYRGVKQDKHGRDHQVYEVMGGAAKATAGQPAVEVSAEPAFDLGPITLNGLEEETSEAQPEPEKPVEPETEQAVEAPPAKTPEEEAAEAERRAQEEEVERRMAEARARQEAEIRAEEEAEAHKLAEEQAKAWADAEQRAQAQAAAQEKIEEAERQAKQQAATAKKHKTPKARRKPLPWGKIGGGLFVLLLAGIAALPYVWPMQGYIPQVEQRISAQLKQPVHIASMSAALFPTPQLVLHNISAGSGQEMRASSMVLHFDFTDLLADTRVIDDADLNGLRMADQSFDRAVSWLQSAGGDARYPLRRIKLHDARVTTEALKLPTINGKIEFDTKGGFSKAELESADGKATLALQPQQGKLIAELTLKDSELPALPYLHFSYLNTKGVLQDGQASFSGIDAQLYGGSLGGNAQLSWQQGWLLQGRIAIKGVDAHTAFPNGGVEGDLKGKASYSVRADKIAHFGGNPMLDGEFSLSKGVFNDMDMVEVVRLASRDATPGGRTHFDELTGKLVLENGIQRYRHLSLSAGVLSASGYFDINTAGELDGHLLAALKVRPGSVPLLLGGKVGEPILRAAR